MNLDSTALAYQSGFGNEFSSEALPGALPVGQNSPQKAPYGLYAELLSGTAFTMARSEARRTWLYRITPSAKHSAAWNDRSPVPNWMRRLPTACAGTRWHCPSSPPTSSTACCAWPPTRPATSPPA